MPGTRILEAPQDGLNAGALFDVLAFDSEDSPLRNMRRLRIGSEPAWQTLQAANARTGPCGNDAKLLIDAMATFDGRMVGDVIHDPDQASGVMTRSFFANERMTRLEMTN